MYVVPQLCFVEKMLCRELEGDKELIPQLPMPAAIKHIQLSVL